MLMFSSAVTRHGPGSPVRVRLIVTPLRDAVRFVRTEPVGKKIKVLPDCKRRTDARHLVQNKEYSTVLPCGTIVSFKCSIDGRGVVTSTTRRLRLPDGLPGDVERDDQWYYKFFYARMCRHFCYGGQDKEAFQRWR